MNKFKEVKNIFSKAIRKSGEKNGLSAKCAYIQIRLQSENDLNFSLRDSSNGMKHIENIDLTNYLSMLQMAFTESIGNKIKEILRELALIEGKNVNEIFVLTFMGFDAEKKETTRFALYSNKKFAKYVDREIKEFLQ